MQTTEISETLLMQFWKLPTLYLWMTGLAPMSNPQILSIIQMAALPILTLLPLLWLTRKQEEFILSGRLFQNCKSRIFYIRLILRPRPSGIDFIRKLASWIQKIGVFISR